MDALSKYAEQFTHFVFHVIERMTVDWRENANKRSLAFIIIAGVGALVLYVFVIAPPIQFPVGDLVTIEEGETAREVAQHFAMQGVVQNDLALAIAIRILGADRGVKAGDYLFKEPKSVFAVARAITTGAFGLEPIRIRIPEGATTYRMAELFASQLQRFDAEKFIEIAQPDEGFLFPDTYFFLPNADEDIVYKALRQNFDDNIASIAGDIESFGVPLRDVVIMASILEKEAEIYRDRRMIAGVLWRRLDIGMALQVDAAFLYSLGYTTFDLTRADLKNEDDPYNTYVHKGLPPGAIGSPSLAALRAAVNPIDEGYLFYLADRFHVTHYSKTYEEHLRKKNLYIGT